ncbi:hypothetical protein [uncultured Rubinisphaera sp.]|uniref:hypothetical protein n=1 Tax=uncultured Rubinisphaera sp. TaxID=1678686 RepID=UPI000ED6B236|nr:hypothetical protein [Planctomycetaceae bacterium]|tara:strand:- start:725 stop:1207 length:483 start_codon:yes stop_codon:yes gene_type:complete
MRKWNNSQSALLLAGFMTLFLSYSSPTQSEEKPPSGKRGEKSNEVEAKPKGDEKDKDLHHFMIAKLKASVDILEGLTTENYPLIKDGATKLNQMSTAEKWRYSNDALYRQFSSEFQRTTQDLIEAADEKNLDKSALKWMDVTVKCIECHRHVRAMLIVTD